MNGSDTCKPLLAMARPEMFRENAFRITGLPVDATTRELSRHADKLKMLEELGRGESVHTAAFALSPPPGVDQIRDAMGCLRDPERRVLDELFWFWPETFGQSRNDPAIQALAGGDRETALEIWLLKETNPTTGVTAMHNVAVLWQLVALEWEEYAGEREIDERQRQEIERYWRDSYKRWNVLTADDLFWENLGARVKQLDDPRLNSGFAQRVRATLPQALDKINAQLAVRYAEGGRMALARVHVDLMRETCVDAGELGRSVELVLAPTRARLQQQLARAKEQEGKNSAGAGQVVRELLEHAQRSFALYDLFHGAESAAKNDLSDEVATLCLRLLVEYEKATTRTQDCLDLLKSVLPLAKARELHQHAAKLIAQAEAKLEDLEANAQLQAHHTALREILESKASPKERLHRLKKEIVPVLAKWNYTQKFGASKDQFSENVARCFLAVMVSAHTEHDFDTALEAVVIAGEFAKNEQTRQRIERDKEQLVREKAAARQNDLSLKIRGDIIEITRETFRFNGKAIPATDISGIRFGVHRENGSNNTSYKVGVTSWHRGTVNIECRRLLRSESQAQTDYRLLVTGLCKQIGSGVVMRLVEKLFQGSEISFGDCRLSSKGLAATTGVLVFKKHHLIPWPEIRVEKDNESLFLRSARNPKFVKKFALRHVWNAVFFQEIVNAVLTRLTMQTRR
ncbi:hypothetical protein [Chthoniobacter flavus]|nr:hypothetical protein [Chthoniobacter flavus]